MTRVHITTLILTLALISNGKVSYAEHSDDIIRPLIHLSRQTGLESNRITALADDRFGRIWTGTTAGLTYYDGRHTIQEELLKGFAVTSLQETELGMIVGTETGCMLFDYSCGIFRHLTSEGNAIRHVLNTICIDGKVYLETVKDIYILNGDLTATLIAKNLPYYTIVQDRYGQLWGITYGDIVYKVGNDFSVTAEYKLDRNGGPVVSSLCAYADSKGKLWVGTLQNGLYHYNRVRDCFLHDRTIGNGIENVNSITEDENGALWIGYNDGICIYDYTDGYYQELDVETADNAVFHTVTHLFRTKMNGIVAGTYFSGMFYIGSENGNYSFMPFDFLNEKQDVTANGIAKGRNGHWWVATNIAGVLEFDNDWNYIGRIWSGNSGIDNNIISISYCPEDNSLWLGSVGKGLYHLSANGKLKHYTHQQSGTGHLQGNKISAVFTLDADSVLVTNEYGIDLYLAEKDSFCPIFSAADGMAVNDVIRTGDDVYFAFENFLLCHSLKSGNTSVLYPDKDINKPDIQCLVLEDDGGLLAGSSLGCIYRKQDDILVNTELSQTTKGHSIDNMLRDDARNIWTSGNSAIYCIDTSYIVSMFDCSHILGLNEFNIRSKYFDPESGELIFGTTNGIMRANPAAMKAIRQHRPDLYIGKFKINNKTVSASDKNLHYLDRIVLEHSQNTLAFNVSIIDYNNFKKFSYRCEYRLEGLDKEWLTMETSGEIKYHNLPPGAYNLHVRLMTDAPVPEPIRTKSLEIRIRPHPLASFPMIILYILAGTAVLGGFIWLQRRQKKTKEDLDKATLEKQAMDEMEKEKFGKLSELTNEIKSPISVISQLQAELADHENADIFKDNLDRLEYLVKQLAVLKESALSNARNISDEIKDIPDESDAISVAPAVTRNDAHDKYRILIIDNDKAYASFIDKKLKKQYLTYLSNGEDCHAILNSQNIDVVLCSNELNETLNLCGHIRQSEKSGRVIFIMMTYEMTEETRIQSLKAGADATIEKPVNMLELELLIENLINNKNSIRRHYSPKEDIVQSVESMNMSNERFIRSMTEYIDANIADENLTVQHLAEHLNVSRTQLYLMVKKLLGTSPVELIFSLRMKKASALLKETGLSITEIAERVGYCNANYFTKQFRTYAQMSPSAFRKMSRPDEGTAQ